MVFSSPVFLFVFFPAVCLVSLVFPVRLQNAWLALASVVFYAFGQPQYTLLLGASVLANYVFGRLLMRAGPHRRCILAFAAAANLLALGAFKYLDFLALTLNRLFGLSLTPPGIVLPIGISFYTFQGLSYVIDVYRTPSEGTKSLGKLLLYISFFPQLIAGPIIKYHDVSAQIDCRERTPGRTLAGVRRFIGGFAKKMLLANTAGKVADAVFALTADALDFRLAWLGAVCYTLQIYFDFSGYSDMAIGLGKLFGFDFAENFNLPYVSRSIREFWRRWHISLSSWFRDYLYIPLGGSRCGKARTMRNKLAVFFATGLWHGANWTFVLWGLWHGLFSLLEEAGIIPKRLRGSRAGQLYTLLVVTLGFVLFRADTLGGAWLMVSKMFTGAPRPVHTLTLYRLLDGYTATLLVSAVLLSLGLPQRAAGRLALRAPAAVREACCAVFYAGIFALGVLALATAGFNPFIYFQF